MTDPQPSERLRAVRALRGAGNDEAYLAAARELAAACPDEALARIEAAYACDRLASEEEAAVHYDAAYRLGVPASMRPDFLIGYGSTLRNCGRTAESVAVLEEAAAAAPACGATRAFLALSLHSAGRSAEAIALLIDLAVELTPAGSSLAGFQRALRHYSGALRGAGA